MSQHISPTRGRKMIHSIQIEKLNWLLILIGDTLKFLLTAFPTSYSFFSVWIILLSISIYVEGIEFKLRQEPKREMPHTWLIRTCLGCQRLRTDVGWKLIFFTLWLDSGVAPWWRLMTCGYNPATRAAFTTDHLSEFTLTSRMSLPPWARTKPAENKKNDADELNSSWWGRFSVLVLVIFQLRHFHSQLKGKHLQHHHNRPGGYTDFQNNCTYNCCHSVCEGTEWVRVQLKVWETDQ